MTSAILGVLDRARVVAGSSVACLLVSCLRPSPPPPGTPESRVFAGELRTGAVQGAPLSTGVVAVGKVRFTAIAPELVRFEYSESGHFIDDPTLFAINRQARFAGVQVHQNGKTTVIDTGRMQIEYIDDGQPPQAGNLSALVDGRYAWRPGHGDEGNLGGPGTSLDSANGPVPMGRGLLSRSGLFVYNDSRGALLKSGWVEQRPVDAGLDVYFFGYGTDFKGALRALTTIGGPVPLPRKYALGSWYSRWHSYSASDLKTIVTESHENDFPLDVVAIDADWHRSDRARWSWNRALFAEPRQFLNWMHQQGLFVGLDLLPSAPIDSEDDSYPRLARDLGKDPRKDETLRVDPSDRRELTALFKQTLQPLVKDGADFFWLNWPDENATAVPGLSSAEWLNQIHFEQSKAGGYRGLVSARWTGFGDHRNPLHYAGGMLGSWPALAFAVPYTSTAGNAGCFFLAHAAGGYLGPRTEETVARWIQFAALSAALRVHVNWDSNVDARSWAHSPEMKDVMRAAYHLRSQLFPYIYSSAWESSRTSVPLLRPLYVENPTEDAAYQNPQEYYFGDALLVAPIVTPGLGPGHVAEQVVWFPSGPWYDWFTNERFDGNREVAVTATLDQIPLFARGGTPIVLQHYTERMATAPLDELVVRVWPGTKGHSVLYEDDGVSDGYLRGEFATTSIDYARTGEQVTLEVGPAQGSYPGLKARRSVTFELMATARARDVKVDGAPTPNEYLAASQMNRIRVPLRLTSKRIRLELTLPEADQNVVRQAAQSRRQAALGSPPDEARLWATRGTAFGLYSDGVTDQASQSLRVYGLDQGFEVNIEEQAGQDVRQVARFNQPRTELASIPEPALGIPVKRFGKLTFTPQGGQFARSSALAHAHA